MHTESRQIIHLKNIGNNVVHGAKNRTESRSVVQLPGIADLLPRTTPTTIMTPINATHMNTKADQSDIRKDRASNPLMAIENVNINTGRDRGGNSDRSGLAVIPIKRGGGGGDYDDDDNNNDNNNNNNNYNYNYNYNYNDEIVDRNVGGDGPILKRKKQQEDVLASYWYKHPADLSGENILAFPYREGNNNNNNNDDDDIDPDDVYQRQVIAKSGVMRGSDLIKKSGIRKKKCLDEYHTGSSVLLNECKNETGTDRIQIAHQILLETTNFVVDRLCEAPGFMDWITGGAQCGTPFMTDFPIRYTLVHKHGLKNFWFWLHHNKEFVKRHSGLEAIVSGMKDARGSIQKQNMKWPYNVDGPEGPVGYYFQVRWALVF